MHLRDWGIIFFILHYPDLTFIVLIYGNKHSDLCNASALLGALLRSFWISQLIICFACLSVDRNIWKQVIDLYPALVDCTTSSSANVGKALKEALMEYGDLLAPPIGEINGTVKWHVITFGQIIPGNNRIGRVNSRNAKVRHSVQMDTYTQISTNK